MALTPVEVGYTLDSAADPLVITVTTAASVGDLVYVISHNAGVTATGVTDTRSNTWTRTVNNAGGGTDGLIIAWSVLTTGLQVNDVINVTTGFTGLHATGQALKVVAGWAASPVDQSSSNAATSAAFTSNATTTTTNANDFMVGGITSDGGSGKTLTPTGTGTWTDSPTHATSVSSGNYDARRSYQEVAATGAYAYSGTISSSSDYCAGIVIFKEPASGSPTGFPFPIFFTPQEGPMSLRMQAKWPQVPLGTTPSLEPSYSPFIPVVIPNPMVGPRALRRRTPWPYRPMLALITTQVFQQAMTATATATASFQIQVNKAMTASASATASIVKQVNKFLTATASSLASFQLQVNKILSATATSTASIATNIIHALSMTANATASASIVKQVNKIVATGSNTASATITKQVNKFLTTGSNTATATIIKQVNKIMTANASATATLNAIKVILLTLTANATATASMSRVVNKALTANASATATITKNVGKFMTAAASATASLVATFHSGAAQATTAVKHWFNSRFGWY